MEAEFMKIKTEIKQEEISVSTIYTEHCLYLIKLEYRIQDTTIGEYTPPSVELGEIDALLKHGEFDNSWLKRILHESITACQDIEDYTNCRDKFSFFLPSFQDKVIPNMSNRFRGNPLLLALPSLDWSNVDEVSGICFNNRGMIEIDMPGSHNIKSWRQAFYGCNSVQRIHHMDLSGALILTEIFNGCSSLQSLPVLATEKVTHFANFINGCNSLERIDGIDFSSAQTDINIGQNLYLKLNNLTALKVNGTILQNIIIYADNLTETSIMSVMNALVETPSVRTITLTKILTNKISEATKKIASDKGWKLVEI